MTTWNGRLLPHPLLAPWIDDYPEATFTAQVPHAVINNGKQINLTIKYHLTSQSLRDLISKGKAHYVSLVACAKTFSRNSYPCEQEDDLCILDAQDFSQELKLTPYVVSKQPIEGFTSGHWIFLRAPFNEGLLGTFIDWCGAPNQSMNNFGDMPGGCELCWSIRIRFLSRFCWRPRRLGPQRNGSTIST